MSAAPGCPVKDVLVEYDPLYEKLYDVRREAQTMGNLVEQDMTPVIAVLRRQAPVHKSGAHRRIGAAWCFRIAGAVAVALLRLGRNRACVSV